MNVIGQPLPRADGAAKVTGSVKYALDIRRDGMLHAALHTAPIAKGRITALDTSAAEAAPGVRLVLSHRNHPRLTPEKSQNEMGAAHASFQPMQGEEIRYHGQAVALVVADTRVQAEHAATLIRATYAAEPAVAKLGLPGLVAEEAPRGAPQRHGDPEQGLRDAAVRVEQTYATPMQHHNAIELYGCVAAWNGNILTVQSPSQGVSVAAAGLARILGLQQDQVHMQSAFVGGGFGGKGVLLANLGFIAIAARMTGRAVKFLMPREQSYANSAFRPATEIAIRLGATAEGRLTALDYASTSQASRFDKTAFSGGDVTASVYNIPHVLLREQMVPMDINTPGFMRAPGEMPSQFALESAVDELCIALRMDPVAFRRLNDAPRHMMTGREWSSRSLNACYERAAALFGWSARSAQPGSMTERGELVGWGCATAAYPTLIASSSATVALESDGRITVRTSAADIGTGTYTVMAQVAAEVLGVPAHRVSVELGDTAFTAGNLAGGSTTALATSNAVKQAAEQLKDALLRAALPMAGGELVALRMEGGEVRGARAVPLTVIAEVAPGQRIAVTSQWIHPDMPEQIRPVLGAGGFPLVPPPMQKKASLALGASFVEVRINPRTRTIRVPRMVGVFAGGTILNARTAHSQLMGGMIWGVGSALREATEMDGRRGCITNNSLADYHLPVNADVGEVVVETVEERDDYIGPIGAKGLGEIGITGVTPAIANAVFHATGIRVRRVPILIEDILPAA